jgi:methyl-accepting chemotaxis protein
VAEEVRNLAQRASEAVNSSGGTLETSLDAGARAASARQDLAAGLAAGRAGLTTVGAGVSELAGALATGHDLADEIARLAMREEAAGERQRVPAHDPDLPRALRAESDRVQRIARLVSRLEPEAPSAPAPARAAATGDSRHPGARSATPWSVDAAHDPSVPV